MIRATLIFPDHGNEERNLSAIPAVGSAIAGPSEAGETWKVVGVVRNGATATITCEAVPPPDWIRGDLDLAHKSPPSGGAFDRGP
jgi:hypothetical protein